MKEGADREGLVEDLRKDVVDAYDEREQDLGDELMRALERFMLLQIIDERWREHLHDMDYLREGIHLRGFAQIDPLVAYKNEGFEMFTELMNNIWDEFARYMFNVEIEVQEPQQPAAATQQGPNWGSAATPRARAGSPPRAGTRRPARGDRRRRGRRRVPRAWPRRPSWRGRGAGARRPVVEPRRLDEHEKIGRNDPCWCGSGKKFKKCHGA